MKKKKILIVTQYFYPEQFRINDMAVEWVTRGYDVTVLTGIPNYPMGKFFKGYGLFSRRKEVYQGVKVIRIPLIPRGKKSIGMVLNYLSFVVSGFFWAKTTRVKADYVFNFEVSPMTQALPAIWFAKRRKIPCDIYVQDLWPENVQIITGITSKIIINPIHKMVDYIYKSCNKIFTTSPSFVENIVARGVSKDKVIYWPQYAEDYYTPLQKNTENDGILKIVFTGNIGVAQGLDILPRTAQILNEKYGDREIKFNIVGDGRYQHELMKLINDQDLDRYFEFHGRIPSENVPSMLAMNDLAFLSFSENPLFTNTIPAKLQSYLACGIPVLASASGESVRILKESNAGLYCNTGDELALVDKIIEFMDYTEAEKKTMANNSRKYFEKNFLKEKLMNDFEEHLGGNYV